MVQFLLDFPLLKSGGGGSISKYHHAMQKAPVCNVTHKKRKTCTPDSE